MRVKGGFWNGFCLIRWGVPTRNKIKPRPSRQSSATGHTCRWESQFMKGVVPKPRSAPAPMQEQNFLADSLETPRPASAAGIWALRAGRGGLTTASPLLTRVPLGLQNSAMHGGRADRFLLHRGDHAKGRFLFRETFHHGNFCSRQKNGPEHQRGPTKWRGWWAPRA